MASRPTKLRKLDDLRRRNPHVTQAALHSILKDVEKHGLPDLSSRQNMTEARAMLANTETRYGPLIQNIEVEMDDHSIKPILVLNVFAFLSHTFNACAAWRKLLVDTHRRHPSSVESPWSLVLYNDEVTPGNALAPDLVRKCQTIYASFKQFGTAILSRENAWMCFFVHRSSLVKQILGGMAQVIGVLLKSIFSATGYNLHETGIFLEHDSCEFRLHARFDLIVQDGAAHKDIWQIKGDNGLRMCLCCDAIMSRTDVAQHAVAGALKQNVIKAVDLNFCTDEEIRNAATRLKACYDANHADRERISMAMGLNYCRYMLLTDQSLINVIRPATQFMHDWMHGLFSSGVFNVLMHYVLEALEDAGFDNLYGTLHDHVAQWNLPKRLHITDICDIFAGKRRATNRKNTNFRAGASEGLSVFPIIAIWLRIIAIPLGMAVPACNVFLAFAAMAECFTSVGRGHVTPVQLQTAVEHYLKIFSDVFGFEPFFPKMHWLLHYWRELRTHGTLLACFVNERKHKIIRRFANPTVNTSTLEKTVIEEVTCQHMWDIKSFDTFNCDVGLVLSRTPSRAAMKCLMEHLNLDAEDKDVIEAISSTSRFNQYETCQRKDVVLVDVGGRLIAGEVWLHLRLLGTSASLISLWTQRSFSRESLAAEWTIVDEGKLCETRSIVATVTWMQFGNVARTLIPSDLLQYVRSM